MGGSYCWIITEDHITDGTDPEGTNCNAKGVIGPMGADTTLMHRHDSELRPQRFRLYDDDGELYYEGLMFIGDDTEEDEETAFSPLDDFGMPNAGCTTIAYWQHETPSPRMVHSIVEKDDTGFWVQV